MRILISLLLLAVTSSATADEPLVCATSEANDARVRALHERSQSRLRLMPNAVTPPVISREGAFYIQRDDRVVPGHRPFDLDGQSLVFEPSGSGYKVRRVALRWVEPSSTPLRDFSLTTNPAPASYVKYDVTGTPPQIFGQPASTLYFSQYNGITLAPPLEPGANQFDSLEAALYPEALISPLLITSRKPSRLAYPTVYAERSGDDLVITWRSVAGIAFGYDVQAELHTDGSIVFSYHSMREMRWGTPIVSRGFDPSATRRLLGAVNDSGGDLVSGTYAAALADANDIRRIDVSRIGESDLLVLRFTLNAPVSLASLANGQALRYVAQIGTSQAWLDADRNGWTITPFGAPSGIKNGGEVRFDGNVVEMYGLQIPPDGGSTLTIRAWTLSPSTNRTIDFATTVVNFDVPVKRIATDLSNIAPIELSLPITEPFILGDFDPYAVFSQLQSAYGVSSYDYDAVAMYQSFYTDLIFYAGAYSTGGNPGVDGIAPPSQTRNSTAPRSPALLHMNQISYGWNATMENASHVILHELGHRWLYFFRVLQDGQLVRALNPVSAHPAGFVSTPAAFKVFNDTEASVMGGATFTESGGRYLAHTANNGFSWTDLYLMGLAAPEEVPSWYYLANTSPALPNEYWPAEGANVTGERRDVSVDQIIAAEGARHPSTALSQRLFRVLFVLVTDGPQPTGEEVAKVNVFRALLEDTFALATGQRGRVETEWVNVPKKRATRH